MHLADLIVIAKIVPVNEEELQHLSSFEAVGDLNSLLKLWIQGVLDLLSVADLAPIITPIVFLEHDALRVDRPAHMLPVFQLTARDEEIDLHLERVPLVLRQSLHHLARFVPIYLLLHAEDITN